MAPSRREFRKLAALGRGRGRHAKRKEPYRETIDNARNRGLRDVPE